MSADLIFRLRERARIRRQIQDRKSVQEGKPDRIADVLEEAANELERLRNILDDIGHLHDSAPPARVRHYVSLALKPCRNCGAIERPDACSGGPWCAYPPVNRFPEGATEGNE